MKVNWNEGILLTEFDIKTEHLDENKKKAVYNLIDKYEYLFAKNKYDIGTVNDYEAHVDLTENKYVGKKPYRCSLNDQKEIEKQITELLNHGLIEESSSPFGSPVTLAYKKEGDSSVKNRLCVDFRDLNKLLVTENQPFPMIEDIIVKTRGAKWFSALDINSAFWSIPVRKRDRYKLGFVTQLGHWQWTCLPFGLRNAPAIFQRILSGILRRHNLQHFCVNYIDDILVFSETFEEHLHHLELLFSAIHNDGFRLKFTKCNLAKHEIKYLGHMISEGMVRPLTDNLVSIRNFPVPKNRKNVRQFLGKINFYHKFIPNAAKILEPFHCLLRKDVPFKWSQRCQDSFEQIKRYLSSSPVLAIFNPGFTYSYLYGRQRRGHRSNPKTASKRQF